MALSEEEIRKVTLHAISDLGDRATPELVKEIVNKVASQSEYISEKINEKKSSGRAILTSFGMNNPGIVTGVTEILSKAGCDIRDMSQKLMDDFYTMIIIIDISNSSKDIAELQTDLNQVAEKLKVKIYLQHEDLFRYMHRV